MNFVKTLVIVAVFVCSCIESEEFEGLKTDLLLDLDKPVFLNYSQIFDTCYFIPLQFDEDNIVGSIDQILFEDDLLIVLDRSKSKSIFIFDTKGNFINKIEKIGKGPGEYIYPLKIEYSQKDKSILVYDSRHSKLLVYSVDGEFKEEVKIPYEMRIRDMIFHNEALYISRENADGKGLVKLDDSYSNPSATLRTHFDRDLQVQNGMIGQYLFKSAIEGQFIYKGYLSNRFLFYAGDSISEAVEINFKSKNLPFDSDEIHDARTITNEMFESGYRALGSSLVDNENHLLFNFFQGKEGLLGIWDKSNNEAYYVGGIRNDMDGLFAQMVAIPATRYNETPNSLIVAIPPLVFNERLHGTSENNYSKKLNEIKVEDFENPILMIYKLRPTILK